MQVIENRALVVKTQYPARITETIKKSKQLTATEVLVNWSIDEVQTLTRLGYRNVPSSIQKDYAYPGLNRPLQHQYAMASFMSLHKRCFNLSDAGTAKTRAMIWAADYLMTLGKIKRVLIVAPLSILDTVWRADIGMTAIQRSVGVAHGSRDRRNKVIEGDFEFVVINHDGLKFSFQELYKAKFDLIIVDECTAYSNTRTDRWLALNALLRPEIYLWMMTGTPAANSPLQAYGLAKLVSPHLVPKYYSAWRDKVMFKVSTFTYLPRDGASKMVYEVLQPAIRFEKRECLDLPPITYVAREVEMEAVQKKYYEKMRKDQLMEVAGKQITAVNGGVLVGKLLQLATGACYSDDGTVIDFHGKRRLDEVVSAVRECREKVLVFATYTNALKALEAHLTAAGIRCVIIDGKVNANERTRLIDSFQSDNLIQVLLLQPAVMAHGVTLTAASTIVWFGPVPSLEIWLQANARIERQGQKNAMTVIKVQGCDAERKMYKVLEMRGAQQSDLLAMYREILQA